MSIANINSYNSAMGSVEMPVRENEGSLKVIKKPKGRNLSIKKIAVMALATQGAAMAPKAEGGIITEALCVTACHGIAFVNPAFIPFVPSCVTFCVATGFLPTP